MATGVLVDILRSGVTTSAGVAVASGKARFYDVGTLTPAEVYSNSEVFSILSQPLTLTAGGTGTVYVTKAVRMIVKDSTDTTTIVDEVVGSVVEASMYVVSDSFNSGNETTMGAIMNAVDNSFGGDDWKYQHSGTATARNIKDWMGEVHVSVKDYGALGDDANDDTAEIQAAITAVSSAGGGIVYFPPGVYRITSALAISSTSVNLVGCGPQNPVIKQMSTSANAISTVGSSRIVDLKITANTASSGSAITVPSGGSLHIDRVEIQLFRTGIGGAGLSQSSISNSVILGDGNSAWVGITGPLDGSIVSRVIFQQVTTTDGTCIVVNKSVTAMTTLVECVAFTNTTLGIDIQGTSANVTIVGCDMSGSTSSLKMAAGVGAVHMVGCLLPGVDDGRTGSPVNFTVATSSSVTPLPSRSPVTRIRATAAVTVTIEAPSDSVTGTTHVIICANASGGAVTWTFNAAWHTTGAVAPTDTNRVSLLFVYEKISDAWYEVSRATTAT